MGNLKRVSMSNADYHKAHGVSSSQLWRMGRSPAHAREPVAQTSAMAIGTRMHEALEAILLGETWPEYSTRTYAVKPDGMDMRTKTGKAWLEQTVGQEVLKVDEIRQLEGMVRAALECRVTADLTVLDVVRQHETWVERSHWWTDRPTGLELKCRPDVEIEQTRMLIDWKKCQDARPDAVSRSMLNYGYHHQAAMYLEGTGAEMFVWVFVEEKPPHGAQAYYAEHASPIIRRGHELMRQHLERWAECERTGEWPTYNQPAVPAVLPAWA